MVGTILPIVYGERRSGRRFGSLWVYTGGCCLGGVALGAVLGSTAETLAFARRADAWQPVLLAAAGVHAVYAGREIGLWRLPLPAVSWQVPRNWLLVMPPQATALVYGVTLGLGVLTRMPVSTFALAAALILLVADAAVGALVFGSFGLARALPVLAVAATTRDTDHLMSASETIDGWEPIMRLLNGVVLAGSAGWLAAGAARGGLA
jgi:hypothetical protein